MNIYKDGKLLREGTVLTLPSGTKEVFIAVRSGYLITLNEDEGRECYAMAYKLHMAFQIFDLQNESDVDIPF